MMQEPYLVLMDSLCIAKARAEMARQRADDYCKLSHQAEMDYSHALRDIERIEIELKWFRKIEAAGK